MRVVTRLNVGGPSLQVAILAKELERLGYRTLVVDGQLRTGEQDMGYLLDRTGVERVRVPSLVNHISPLQDLATVRRLYRIMRSFRPEVLHTHHAKAGALGRLAGWLAGVPVRIHTFHGHAFRGHFGRTRVLGYVVAERLLARITTRIVAISKLQERDLTEDFRIAKPGQTEVIPLGLDLARFTAARGRRGFLRGRFNLPAGARLVGIVGRLAPVKNHDLFLRAARHLLSDPTVGDLRFAIVGDGECESALRSSVAAAGLGGRVLFCSTVRNVEDVYADLDVLVLCSHSEGTPLTVIEAMTCGTPVIATAVGGVPDVIHDGVTGRLVPADDDGVLAAAIRDTLATDAVILSRQTAAARSFVLASFSQDRLVGDIDRLYRTCLSESRRDTSRHGS